MVELVGDDLALLTKITDRFLSCYEGPHRKARDLWRDVDRLYHGYTQLKENRPDGDPSRYGGFINNAREEFGHELFIPYAFSIVETVLPRLLSNRPRMLVLPGDQQSERNVENMRALIDKQQNHSNYELQVQSAGKSGLMYGLGPMKTYWSKKVVNTTKVAPSSFVLRAMGQPYKVEQAQRTLCDDPRQDPLNVRDFFWDPYGTCMDDMRWIIHRTWRDTDYVLDKIQSGQWSYTDALTREDLDQARSAQHYNDSRTDQLDAQNASPSQARDTDIHEVWEYHDRTNVVTVLDRKWIVNSATNEAWAGCLPFQAYRPTEVPNQFLGKGEIEPIRDLQYEMNHLRTHRRWSAETAMNPIIFYSDGLIGDPRKVRLGPGAMNPVLGDPNEVLHIMQMPDIPFSSYREAQEIASDIERASGISDTTAGADAGAAQTATGIQLVQAAANARIQLKTRRVEVELIREGCRHWGAMNQRFILQAREVQVPAPPTPEEPDRTSAWLKLGPEELAGEFDFEPEGGSTTPENIPQKRQDAQIKLSAMQMIGQMIDPQRWVELILEDLGVKNAKSYIVSQQMLPEQTVNTALLTVVQQLTQMGMDPGQAQQMVQDALAQAMDQQEQAQQAPSSALPDEPQAGQPPQG